MKKGIEIGKIVLRKTLKESVMCEVNQVKCQVFYANILNAGF